MTILEHERLRLPAHHPDFADHFPNDPIVPGALLLALAFAEFRRHGLPRPKRITRVKFHQPGRPGQMLFLTGRASGNAGEFAVAIEDEDGKPILSLRYRG